MVKELPKLDYEYSALEPYIDEDTMMIHHSKHHQAYIDKLNAAIKGTEFEKMCTCDILKELSKVPENIRMAVRNNGGGHFNHTLFWKMLSPKSGKPSAKLAKAIDSCFGSFDKFKEEFEKAGAARFGSGWAWLVFDKGKLWVISTQNQDNPISEGKGVVFGVDVWEHAYYLKYQNKRPDYLKAIWNVINWDYVSERYEKLSH
ncbi:superoxide dismutase [Candidatus Woesearchaeota archaeon]|nr:superoxide dismutase [Candidatus Woesearchaeota archaeon]